MGLIFSPLDEAILEGPVKPIPRGAFMMLPLGDSKTIIEHEIDETLRSVLKIT